MRVTFDVSRVATLTVALGRAGQRAKPRAAAALRKTARDIEGDAKVLAPVDTGNLKASISASFSPDGLAAEIGPTADYGLFVEVGTSTMPGQPFLGPAFDRRAPELEAALAQMGADI